MRGANGRRRVGWLGVAALAFAALAPAAAAGEGAGLEFVTTPRPDPPEEVRLERVVGTVHVLGRGPTLVLRGDGQTVAYLLPAAEAKLSAWRRGLVAMGLAERGAQVPSVWHVATAAALSARAPLEVAGPLLAALDRPPLPHPPGAELDVPIAVARHDDLLGEEVLYVLGGRRRDGADLVPNRTVWKHLLGLPKHEAWVERAPVPEGLAVESAVPLGPAHILAQATRRPVGAPVLLLYHTFTDRWIALDLPADRWRGATLAARDDDSFFIVRRDDRGRIAAVDLARVEVAKTHFRWADYAVMAAYLGFLLAIGAFYARRERSTKDYFLGGRRVPWWAAGLSIYATGISAISFMAIPAKTYATNWLYISQGIFPVVSTVIVAYAFLPLLRRLDITTIMEYQEMRFGKSVRLLSSALTVLGQIAGRMAVVMLLPAIALAAVTGLDTVWAILIMGVLATAYTVAGGIHAVIWTDVLQVGIVFGGAGLSLVLVAAGTEGGWGAVLETGLAHGKFTAFDWSWDFARATVWVFCIWSLYDMISARLGQEAVQRAFSTEGVREARRSMIACAAVSVPGTLLFYGVGAALFAYYHSHPAELDPTLATDGIFPLFIAQKLPAGLAGLVVAGLFAAAMSTLDSGMNTVATIAVTDWYGVSGHPADERTKLRMARIVTLAAGMLATGMALYMAALDVRSLWDVFIKAMQLILGGLGGVMFLGMLTRRANTPGLWAGIATGTAAMWVLRAYAPISFFTYGTIAMVVCIVVGYAVSLATGGCTKDLAGLTVWTPRSGETD